MTHQPAQPGIPYTNRKSHDYVRVPWFVRSRLVVALAVLVMAGILGMIAMYWHYKPETVDRIDFTAKTLLGTAAVVSLVVAFQTLVLKIYSDKVKAAFDFLARFDKIEEREARRKVGLLLARTGSLASYRDDLIPGDRILGFKAALNDDDRNAAYAFLAYVEDIALAIRSGFVHEAVLCRSIRPTLVRLLDGLRPFVVITQFEEEDPSYYEEAMFLWEQWRRGSKLDSIRIDPRHPFRNWMWRTYDHSDFGAKLSAVPERGNSAESS